MKMTMKITRTLLTGWIDGAAEVRVRVRLG